MLINQQNSDILSLSCEPLKGFFDSRIVGLAVDNEKVLLRIGGLGDMLRSISFDTWTGEQLGDLLLQFQLVVDQSLSPASGLALCGGSKGE